MPTNKRNSKQAPGYRILAMVLIGGGLLVIGVVALLLLPSLNSPESETQAEVSANGPAIVDFAAPDIQLQDLGGEQVSLADFRGQVVLVNNWATWCPPCRAEMPILDEYYQDHRHQEFTVVAIDSGDPADVVKEFVNSYQISFPIWVDPTSSAVNSFRNNYLPSSYLVNEDGQVVRVWSGAVTRASLEENITPMLKD